MKKSITNIVLTAITAIFVCGIFAVWPRTKESHTPHPTVTAAEHGDCKPPECSPVSDAPWVTISSAGTIGATILPPVDPIASLRAEAHKRGIRWRIFCIGEDRFAGWAIQPGAKFELYIEEGAKDEWLVSDDLHTQTAAASALLKAIQFPTNMKAVHKPKEEKQQHQCPPTLHGE